MTYKELLAALSYLTPVQLNRNVIIELEHEEECVPAELRICDEDHFCLDEGHPVIFTKEY